MGRSATPTVLSTGALCLAFIVTSCGTPEANQATPPAAPSTASPPSDTTTPSAGPEDSVTSNPTTPATSAAATSPPASPAPAADLVTYTTSDGALSFDHPIGWAVAENPDTAASGGVSVVVHDAAGRQLATLQTDLVIGSVCSERVPYSVIDSQPLPALAQAGGMPTFRFESRTNPHATDAVQMTTFAYGITSSPDPTGPDACPIAHFFPWPPSGAAFAGIYDPFDTSPGRPMHVDTPQAYTETEEYQQIKAMITSLRPTG